DKAAAIATPTGTVATSPTETSPFSTAIVCGEATGSALRFSTSSRLVFSKSGEAKPASPGAPQTARAAVPPTTPTTPTWRGLITPRAFSRVRQIMPHNQARNELFFDAIAPGKEENSKESSFRKCVAQIPRRGTVERPSGEVLGDSLRQVLWE